MDFDEIRLRLALGTMGALMVVGLWGWWSFRTPLDPMVLAGESRESAPPEPDGREKIREMVAQYRQHSGQKDRKKCQAVAALAKKKYPEEPETASILSSWDEDRLKWMKEALERGQEQEAGQLLAGILTSARRFPDPRQQGELARRAHEVHGETSLAVWMKTRDPRRPAAGLDLVGAALASSLHSPRLENEISREIATFFDAAFVDTWIRSELGHDRPEVAFALARPAIELTSRLPDSGKQVDELRALRTRSALAVVAGIDAGKLTGSAEVVERLLGEVSGSSDPAERAKALDLQKNLRLHQAREATAAKSFSQAHGLMENAIELAKRAWVARIERPGADPWPEVPADVVERIEDENPGAQDAERIGLLRQLVEQREYFPTEAIAIRDQLPDLYVAWGLEELSRDRDMAFDLLRRVLRRSQITAAARRSVEGLQEAIRKAAAGKDFGALLELCGFYVAECVSKSGKDPFRDEMRRGLEGASEAFRTEPSLKRVFMLSLIADLFPDEEAGKTARAEAMATALQILEKTPSQGILTGASSGSSGIAGTSLQRIENGTTDHLLVFFQGPETFFVRIPPTRRATVALLDGDYQVAVVVTDEAVQPFRGAQKFASDRRTAKYFIQRQGASAPGPLLEPAGGMSTYGPFTLVRSPPGADAGVLQKVLGAETDEEAESTLGKALDALAGKPDDLFHHVREVKRHRKDPRAFEALRRLAATHPDVNVRAQVIEALVPFRRHFDVRAFWLERMQAEKESLVPMTLVRLACQLRFEGAGELLARAGAHPHATVRGHLVAELGEKKDVLEVTELEKILLPIHQKDPEANIRRSALRSLALRRSPTTKPLLRTMLESPDTATRSQGGSLLSISYMDDPQVHAWLLAALAKETDRGLRGDMFRWLGGKASPGLVPVLTKLVTSPEARDRSSGLFHLYYWGGDSSPFRDAVQRIATSDPDAGLRKKALERLAQFDEKAKAPR